jgi:hypothetical protein
MERPPGALHRILRLRKTGTDISHDGTTWYCGSVGDASLKRRLIQEPGPQVDARDGSGLCKILAEAVEAIS